MGNKHIAIFSLIFLLVSTFVLGAVPTGVATPNTDTATYRALQEAIDRQTASITKAITEAGVKTTADVNKNMDVNYQTLDTNTQKYLQSATRNMGIIVLIAMVAGFALGQVIRLQVDRMRRRDLILKAVALQDQVELLDVKVKKMTGVVNKLTLLEGSYKKSIEEMKETMKPRKFPVLLMVLMCLIGMGLGILGYILFSGVKVI